MSMKIQLGDLEKVNHSKHTMKFEMDCLEHYKDGRYAIIDVSSLSLLQMEKLTNFITNEL